MVPNIDVDSSTTPLLTENKVSSLLGQVCSFHTLSTLELVEKGKGFCYARCPAEKLCFIFALASEWKEDRGWIAHYTHSNEKQYAAHLVCDCFNKQALRKSTNSLGARIVCF